MGLEEVNGPKGLGKREMPPMGSIWYGKVRMGRGRLKAMQIKKVGVDGKPMNPKDENEEIGPRKPNQVSKNPWEHKVSKRAEEARGK